MINNICLQNILNHKERKIQTVKSQVQKGLLSRRYHKSRSLNRKISGFGVKRGRISLFYS